MPSQLVTMILDGGELVYVQLVDGPELQSLVGGLCSICYGGVLFH
jgi:hypothetical protein